MSDKSAPTGEQPEYSETEIAVHWREEEYVPPASRMRAQANARDEAILERFTEEHFPACFEEYAELLSWDRRWDAILDDSKPPFFRWWVGGRLNACVNCVDRHVAERGDRDALIWIPEREDEPTQAITYSDLHRRTNEFAAMLREFVGAAAGDRITFHLPMVPELPVSMLACARLGVIHSEVFGGFSGAACGQRMADADSTVLVTMDAYYRNGQLIDHKVKADEAVEEARKHGLDVDKVLVWRRHPGEYHSESPMVEGRDVFVDDVLSGYRGADVDPCPWQPKRRSS
jgi:acetyl-CoA synthetase